MSVGTPLRSVSDLQSNIHALTDTAGLETKQSNQPMKISAPIIRKRSVLDAAIQTTSNLT